MSDQARKYIIRTCGVLIVLLAAGAALLPLERGLPGRLVVGWLLVAAGAIELVAAMARRVHWPSGAIAAAATMLAGFRLAFDEDANFFPVLNMVILWLVIRMAALAFAASRSMPPLRGWLRVVAATDFLLAVMLLAGIPIALIVYGLFGTTSEIIATFAWVLAISFVVNGAFLFAAAPIEASERD
ncbi:hypothetical protein [Sphingomonas daechungensis]|uniref:hypothetical protein n=1 Tax=Sphingomonas daechungensis TaxID=1176646 RepID=UPI0037845A5D